MSGLADRRQVDEERLAELVAQLAGAASASRVLPVPPRPVSVTRRTSGRRSELD